jgi:hypothetical protein
MLALGMLIVHDAFDTRVGSKEVALLPASRIDIVEFVVKSGTALDAVEFIEGYGTVLEAFADPAKVGRASTYSLDEETTTTTFPAGSSVVEDVDATGKLTLLATDVRLVDRVMLVYGADGLG